MIVIFVIISDNFLIFSEKPMSKNPFNIESNILNKFFSSGYGKHKILKCLVNLWFNSLWQLPEFDEHAKIIVFSINFQVLSFLSYNLIIII